MDKTVSVFGRIDTLIVNAGTSIHASFAEIKPDDLNWIRELMELNYWGSVWPIHAVVPVIPKATRIAYWFALC
ncbi:SDR family NAD(P)-dependent oxidoreductase [Ochrobactrum sp. CGA5]|uniref:SDR family NAD(P)-dependent oxidoreductase n=1 Tax=Ochrobactrum sp. CGA5 TaxID=2583453 RepID=UPI0020003166|nr:SDR family NAD(P)-dependent oxidoreductase [Ochrobactrum sp. CGA5]